MFYHNLITIITNKWHIFVKLRSSSFIWCNLYDADFMHEWLKPIWRKATKKSFGGWYVNFEENFTLLESSLSALSYDTSSIRRNDQGIKKFCLFKLMLAFPSFDLKSLFSSRIDKRLNSVSLTISHAWSLLSMSDRQRNRVKSFINSVCCYGRQPVKTMYILRASQHVWVWSGSAKYILHADLTTLLEQNRRQNWQTSCARCDAMQAGSTYVRMYVGNAQTGLRYTWTLHQHYIHSLFWSYEIDL